MARGRGPGAYHGPMDPSPPSHRHVAAVAGQVELLVAHLAGPALRSRVGHEDLVADVLVRLMESDRARGLEGEELVRYARAVTRSVVVDAARRARWAPRRMSSLGGTGSAGPAVEAPGTGPGPGTLAARGEEAGRLVAAFLGLAPEHRRVIGLRRFEGLSAREAAARMGRTETAVHSLLRRALGAWAEASGISGGSRGESDGAER